MVRKRLAFVPTWEGPIEGYAFRYVVRNVWRVSPEYDVEDMMQEAYLIFMRVCDMYPLVTEPQHFMALFQRALFNRTVDLAKNRTKRCETLNCDLSYSCSQYKLDLVTDGHGGDASGQADARHGEAKDRFQEVDFAMLVADAPRQVWALLQAAEELERPNKMRRRRGVRETTNSFLCRMIGANPRSTDLRGMFENWINGEMPC